MYGRKRVFKFEKVGRAPISGPKNLKKQRNEKIAHQFMNSFKNYEVHN